MSIQFFYEDGQGNVVDIHGRPEPMDYIVDGEQYLLETVSSYTQYLRNMPRESDHGPQAMQAENAKKDVDVRMREASVKRAYTLYTDQDKVRFFKLMFEKCLSASAIAKQLGIHVRTAQRWAKQYEQDPDSIFEKRRKNGRPRFLDEEHKKVVLEYIDENPSAVLEQLMERLFQRFEGLNVSKSTVYNFVRIQCNLFLKKARFQPVSRNSEVKIQERFDWVRKWEKTDMATTRARTTTILGAISASGLIKCSLRLPQPPAKKRKRGGHAEYTSTGTVTAVDYTTAPLVLPMGRAR